MADADARPVGGVDGCRGGWVLCTLDAAGRITVELVPEVALAVDLVRTGALALLGIDMPIALPATWGRQADDEARRRLGPRRSSLFPTPPRFLLDHCDDFADANAASRAATGRGLSIQTFHLLAKVAELQAALGPVDEPVAPDLAERVVECHPESCFATLAGAPLTTTKRTADGRRERSALLQLRVADDLAALLADRPPGVAADDLLDAVAAAEAMGRHRRGEAMVLGGDAVDDRGLPLRLVA
ncbi:MAG: DUF429 domain-containing protein [Acidimicrobiales bacterium]